MDKKHMIETFHTENIVTEQQLLEYFKTGDIIEKPEAKEEDKKEDITLDEISKLLATIVKLLNTTKKVELNLEIKQIKNDVINREQIVPDHILDDEHVFYILIKK